MVLEREIAIAASIDGGAGDDLIVGAAGNDTLAGGDDNDFLIGNGGNDSLVGGKGNDQLEGGAGGDTLDGGEGRDKVSYYEVATEGVRIVANGNQLVGQAGDALGDTFTSIEYFVGTRFNDTLSSAHDASDQPTATLEGREGDDFLQGSDNKKDFLLGGAGADTLRGGALEDGTSYLSSYGAVHIDLHNGVYRGGDAEGDVLDSIEDVQGSAFDDFIVGDNGNNVIDGFIGDDIVTGFGGIDTVSGGAGNDTVYAYGDGDRLDGGGLLHAPDRDLLTYELSARPGVTVDLSSSTPGNDRIVTASKLAGIDPLTNRYIYAEATGYSTFEDLTGSKGNDTLKGDKQGNVIRGLAGSDTLDGYGGNDTLIGGDGANFFIGGDGFDWVDYSETNERVKVDMFASGVRRIRRRGGPLHRSGGGFGGSSQLVENVRGTRFNDTIDRNNHDNIIDPGLSDTTTTNLFGDLVGPGRPQYAVARLLRRTAGQGHERRLRRRQDDGRLVRPAGRDLDRQYRRRPLLRHPEPLRDRHRSGRHHFRRPKRRRHHHRRRQRLDSLRASAWMSFSPATATTR